MKNQFEFNEDVGGYFATILICYFIIVLTLGIGTPWALCRLQRWKANNTTLNGRKVKFIGEGSALLGKFIIWYLLTIITFGIYGIWAAVKMQKFMVEHTIIEE
jgi:uncharacterized membrane protein YjgN (DUF898 family)